MTDRIPEGITQEHILNAFQDFDNGVRHKFKDSIKYDLVYNSKRYPPKAIIGLAARRLVNDELGPSDFKGGEGTHCFSILRKLGFNIETKIYYQPTHDRIELDKRVAIIRRHPHRKKPKGNKNPRRINTYIFQYERDPEVKAWVLDEANGKCELCGSLAPFTTDGDCPYLEVHHVVPLANRGPDTVDNAVALCPNCHRKCHYSHNREAVNKHLYQSINRLSKT